MMHVSSLTANVPMIPSHEERANDLVEAARRGDRDAAGALYERFAPVVHGILLGRVPVDEVADVVQDVFISAMTHLDSLRDPALFPAWLAQIARNRASDWWRRSRPASPLEPEHEPATRSNPRHRIEAERVLGIIRALPDAYRETLILRLVEGLTGPEIAARTGLTPGSVRVNLHRGMKLLRARIEGGNDD